MEVYTPLIKVHSISIGSSDIRYFKKRNEVKEALTQSPMEVYSSQIEVHSTLFEGIVTLKKAWLNVNIEC